MTTVPLGSANALAPSDLASRNCNCHWMPGLLFAWTRCRALLDRPGDWLTEDDAAPIAGVSLVEAAVWLGAWPLLVYFTTFAPAFFYAVKPLTLDNIFRWQGYMLQLQDSVTKPHTYMSRWWQWVFNLRPIWFLYENVDGAQRGVLMLGNPFTMLAGLPALAACAWSGWRHKDTLRGGIALLYAAALVFWALNGKPVQFYYHYQLAAVFLMAALALVLGGWWDTGKRGPVIVSVVLAVGLFAVFYPILSAGPLPGKKSYTDYTWLHSWR